MRSKQAKITVFGVKDLEVDLANLGLCGSPTQVAKIFTPPARPEGEKIGGTAEEIAVKLAEILKKEI